MEDIEEELPMEEIENFANQIKSIGKKYKIQLLEEFGDDVLTYTINFDIENMQNIKNTNHAKVRKQ